MIPFRTIGVFFVLFHRFSVRHILKHPGRALIVVLGISLGAAVFTSVRLSIQASLASFDQSMSMIAGSADRVVFRPGGGTPDTLVAPLSKLAFVKSASPVLTAYVRPAREGAEPFLLIGFDPVLDRPFREWRTETGEKEEDGEVWLNLMKTPYSMLAGESLLKNLELASDDAVTIEHVGRAADFTVLASLSSEGLALVEGGRVAICDIATFQEFTGKFGQADRIDLLFESPPSESQLDQIEALLPEGVFLELPDENRRSGLSMIGAYRLNLSVLSFVSLFVGMFLVYSLVALNAASRRNEIAILRSTGAPAMLIFLVFIGEGALFGLAGWLTAFPVGAALTKYMLRGVSETISTLFVRVAVEKLDLSGWEVFLSFGSTLFISILAAFYPAREAMGVSPKEAMAVGGQGVKYRKAPKRLGMLGILCVLMVWPLSNLPSPESFPLPGYIAVFLLFAGFSMLSPGILSKLGEWSAPRLRRVGKEPAYLAARYIRDSGARTAISAGALITATALFCALAIMVHSFRQTVELWAYDTVAGDIFIRAKMADVNRYRDPIPDKTVRFLQGLDVPPDMDVYRRLYLVYAGEYPYQFEALTWDVYLEHGRFFWIEGDPETGIERLKRGEGALVSEVFANRVGLETGDAFEAYILGAPFRLPIVGVVRDYRTQGGVVYYSLKHFRERTGDAQWGGVRLFFEKKGERLRESVVDLKSRIIACCGDEIEATEGEELRKAILKIFDETFAITTVLLMIALLVAALGIASTLAMNVLERRRELNTILAVGGGIGQVRAMIFWEALLLVLAGELSGLACGFILSWILVFVINKQSFGWTFLYGVDFPVLALSFPLIVLAALAAALPAVKMAFREPPAALLRER